MTVTVRLFAAAAEAAGAHEVSLDVSTVAQLRATLAALGHDAGRQDSGAVIRQCAILEAGVRREDDHLLTVDALIDVMPPFAGG